jgi:SAM-dependent methyltransferase
MIPQFKMLARSLITMPIGAGQNFLGAWWVPLIVERSPARIRKLVALRVLSFSPHYFSHGKVRVWMPRYLALEEAERNFRSRAQIANDIIRPHVAPADTVVDFGCGPGYMAWHVSRFVKRVLACDISDGALACARALNWAANIDYVNARRLADQPECADLIYSFAVAQHVRDAVLGEILSTMHRILRPGGILLMHVVVNGSGWRTESEWVTDASAYGRLRLKYGLNCFSRTPEQILGLAERSGFADCQLLPLANLTQVEDDVAGQHLLSCHTAGRGCGQPETEQPRLIWQLIKVL